MASNIGALPSPRESYAVTEARWKIESIKANKEARDATAAREELEAAYAKETDMLTDWNLKNPSTYQYWRGSEREADMERDKRHIREREARKIGRARWVAMKHREVKAFIVRPEGEVTTEEAPDISYLRRKVRKHRAIEAKILTEYDKAGRAFREAKEARKDFKDI